MIAKGLTRQAKADYKPGTIRLLGGASTLIPGDWTQFEKDTGLKMEFSLLKDDPGVFFNDVMVNDAGSRYDIISMLAGVQGKENPYELVLMTVQRVLEPMAAETQAPSVELRNDGLVQIGVSHETPTQKGAVS